MNLQQYKRWHQQWSDASTTPPRPLVMGILNVTPDSFFDGGHFEETNKAVEHAQTLIEHGADIIDIGGESSRPGADIVETQQELDRVLPVIAAIRQQSDIILSIDSYKPQVIQAAVETGANFVNDITAMPDTNCRQWLADKHIPICLMHMQKTPRTMQLNPSYPDGLIHSVYTFLQQQADACLQDGIAAENIIIDPGFGFGKTVTQNLTLLQQINQLTQGHFPVLLGISRKSTLGEVCDQPVERRVVPGIAASVYAQTQGVAIFRTHDVADTRAAITMMDAIRRQPQAQKAFI